MARDCSCTHTAKISFLLTLLWWEGAGAIPSSVQTHCKQQIPSPCVTLSSKSQQKINRRVYQLVFDTGWKDTNSGFSFITLHGAKFQSYIEGKASCKCSTWKKRQEVSLWDLGHMLWQKRAAAAIHTPWGRTDWSSHLEVIRKPRNCST